jgi:hypothetical protein
MMAKQALAISVALLIGSLPLTWPICPAPDDINEESGPSVVVRASVPRREYYLLEPIEIEFEVRNTGDDVVFVGGARNLYASMTILVNNGAGQPLPITAYGESLRRKGRIMIRSPLGIWPGKTFKGKLTADLLYDMRKPDDYSITVGFPIVSTTARRRTTSYAESVKVRVVARPERKGPRTSVKLRSFTDAS